MKNRLLIISGIALLLSPSVTALAGEVLCEGRVATIVGTSGDDEIAGTPDDDVIHGGRGADTITGGEGNDLICAGAGANDVSGGPEADRIYGTVGPDTLAGNGGPDFISSGGHYDTLSGGEGNDALFGKASGDVLEGGPGDDRIVGGSRRTSQDFAVFSSAPGPMQVDLRAGTAFGEGDDELVSIESVYGSSFDDVVAGSPARNQLFGSPRSPTSVFDGNDHLIGRGGDDRLFARGGHDVLEGLKGSDYLGISWGPSLTSPGATELYGGPGFDRLELGAVGQGVQVDLGAGTLVADSWTATVSSFEFLFGTRFDDHIAGTDGSDIIWTGGHHAEGDEVHGRAGVDLVRLEVGPATDRVFLGDGNDHLFTGYTSAIVYGGDGNDDLGVDTPGFPDSPADFGPYTLYGESGDDLLVGSQRDDTLLGGGGVDQFSAHLGTDTCDVEAGEQADSCEQAPPPQVP